jgi:DNA repair photolyase
MEKRVEFVSYRPKTILNKHRRPDHWFWTRYTAYPYKGCQHRCFFCYCRERKYCPFDDLNDFGYVIQVKENAPDLLRRALSRAPVDVVGTGDYQAAERRFGLSRRMLEVCLDLGFPVSVLERSPLVLRDLDLLKEINERARAVMMWSIIYTPDSAHRATLRAMEQLAPPPGKRFAAMEQFARAGILTGTCMMPILPDLCDTDENLEAVVRWTAERGGQFVMAGGLTFGDRLSSTPWNWKTPQASGCGPTARRRRSLRACSRMWVCRKMGRKGLGSIENVGLWLVEVFEDLLRDWT